MDATDEIIIPPAQAKMAKYVVEYFLKHGLYPATRETQREFGFASQTAVLSSWNALQRKGVFHSAEERQARAVMPVWSKIIENARQIWYDFQLYDFYVEIDWQDGTKHCETYQLPDQYLIFLWLLQESRYPTRISVTKVAP
jgi:SOS-response transcriptional repressor LexA